MPIYIYKCPTCGLSEEHFATYNDVKICPSCHTQMPKAITAHAFVKMAPRKKWRGGSGAIHSHDFDNDIHRITGGDGMGTVL